MSNLIMMISYFKHDPKKQQELNTIDEQTFANILNNLDFEKILIPQIKEFFERECQRIASSDYESELLLLQESFTKRIDSQSSMSDINDQEYFLYSLISYLQCKKIDDYSDLIHFMLNPTISEKNRLFIMLHRKRGLDLYNKLLCDETALLTRKIDGIGSLDPFLATNCTQIYDLLSKTFNKKILGHKFTAFTKISFAQFDSLCAEYLARVDPTLNWLQTYELAKHEGNIQFVTGKNYSWKTFRKEDTNYLIAPLTGTLEDVSSMIHEFPHYIVISNIKETEQISLTLREFASLFFEDDLCDFLLEKGFPPREIAFLRQRRANWTQEDFVAVTPYLYYLSEYQTNGELTRDTIKERLISRSQTIGSSIRNLPENFPKIPPKMPNKLENKISCQIDEEIYNRNSFLLRKKIETMERYPYVIGSYLTILARRQQKTDQDVLKDMIRYTEQLGKTSPEEIFSRFGINITPQNHTVKQFSKR